jgi:PAS domain S-box-containing protein
MHRRKDGSVFPIELSAGHFEDRGRRSRIVAIRDITDRISSEERLRKSEEKYRSLYESMMDAYVTVDMAGRIQEFNPAYKQLTGYTEEELRQLTYQQLTPPEWHDFEAQILRDQVLPRGYSDVYEKQYLRKDGNVFPVELRTFLKRDAAGEPVAMWAIVRDISESKRARVALQQTEERFRNVAEAVSDFIWEVDADGLYRFASPAVEKILGYTPPEMIGRMHFYDLFAPDIREQLKSEALRTIETRQPFQRFLNPNIRKDGKTAYLETSGIPIFDESGTLLGYRGADTDVTARHQAEMEAQLLRQELAHYSRAATVGELTASLAHEIHQPLAAIRTNAEAALHMMNSGRPDLKELHAIFQDIIDDNQRAAEVIRTLRAMFKKGATEHRRLDLNDLVSNVLPLVRTDALKRGVSIVLDLSSPKPLILGDRVQLQQVILNLILNAFEAMEVPGQPRTLLLRTLDADGDCVLDVVDSGVGISPDKLDSIFQSFFTTKATGLGMGLSLSRSIAYAHQGRLWAENNPGRGATFHLVLPAASTASDVTAGNSRTSTVANAGHPWPGYTVLVADDREPFRHTMLSMLADLPGLHRLVEAADGAEAVEKAVELEPDLILLDVGLPKLNGMDAAMRMRRVVPNSKILFLSQYDSPDFVRAALKTGAVGYVLKVDAATELLTAATIVLRGDQYLSSHIQARQPPASTDEETSIRQPE